MKPLIDRLRAASVIHGDDELTDRLAVELRNAAHDGHPHCPTTLVRDLAGALIALEAVIESPLPEVHALASVLGAAFVQAVLLDLRARLGDIELPEWQGPTNAATSRALRDAHSGEIAVLTDPGYRACMLAGLVEPPELVDGCQVATLTARGRTVAGVGRRMDEVCRG